MEQQYEALQRQEEAEYRKFRVSVYPEAKTIDIRMYGKSLPGYFHEFVERPFTPLFTNIQVFLDYWLEFAGYTAVKIKLQAPAIWESYFDEIKRYAREEDFEFLRNASIKIKCFAPILVEIMQKIEKKYNAKVEISISRDSETGDRVFVLVSGLKFKNLEERYELEDKLERVVWSIIEKYKREYDPSEVEEVNVLVSILVLDEHVTEKKV